MWRRRWAGVGLVLIVAAGVAATRLPSSDTGARTIGVGPFPWAVSLDPRSGHAYVVERTTDPAGMSLGMGSVSVVDLGHGTILHTLSVGTDPRAIGVDERSGRVFVANDDDASVSILDARTGAHLRTIAVGGEPRALAMDGPDSHVFVANSGDSTVSILDARSGLVLHTTRVGGLSFFKSVAIAVAADRVLLGSGATITVLDAHSGALLHTVTVNGDIRHMAVDSRTGQVFVVGPGGLGVLDPRRGWTMRTLAVGGNLSAVAVDAARGRVYVANAGATDRAGTLMGAGTVSIINAASGAVLRTVPVGVAPSSLAVDARTGRAIVVNAGGRVLLPTAWNWLPGWLSHLLPFLPRPDSGPPSVHGSVSVLDAPPSSSQ